MNVFLQGVPGAGKSTIIKKLLEERRITPCGIVTLPEGGRDGRSIHLFSAKDELRKAVKENKIGERLGDGRFLAYPEVFDDLGVRLLMEQNGPFILLDEIGFMENEAFLYQKRIMELLEGDIPILGVIKAKETPFIERLRNHPKSVVVQVTEENRDQAYERVQKLISFETLQNETHICHIYSV